MARRLSPGEQWAVDRWHRLWANRKTTKEAAVIMLDVTASVMNDLMDERKTYRELLARIAFRLGSELEWAGDSLGDLAPEIRETLAKYAQEGE